VQHRPPRLLAAAADSAARGWAVFPLWPGSKRPAIRGWQQHATTEPGIIAVWWERHPYNVGVACGPSGLLVIDIDDPAAEPDGLPATYTVSTPRGEHRYYSTDLSRPGLSSAGVLGSHVDTRGAGGYVVAAGSILRGAGGPRFYRVCRPAAVAPAPSWLLETLESPRREAGPGSPLPAGRRSASALLAAEAGRVSVAAPGSRNTTLFTAALRLGRLVAAGVLDESTVGAALVDACADHVGRDGFTAGEAARAIRNGLQYARRSHSPG
jgi:hypothetical protein